MRRPSPRPYISDQGGWPLFWILTGLALALGLLVRNLAAPTQLSDRIRAALSEIDPKICVAFRNVRLSLADGPWPSLALEVTDLRATPQGPDSGRGAEANDVASGPAASSNGAVNLIGCPDGQPILTAESVRLPLRWSRVLRANWSASEMVVTGLQLDLDRLNVLLRSPRAEKRQQQQVTSTTPVAEPQGIEGVQMPRPWWSSGDLARLDRFVEALIVRNGTILFEEGQKRVSVFDLRAEIDADRDQVRLNANLALDASVTYGEVLPAIQFDGVVEPRQARVTARSQMAEGDLRLVGVLQSGPADQQPKVDLQVAVNNIPVSMLSGLITKSGIVEGQFKAKALWLSCRASIRGPALGLLDEAPLQISDCQVEGQGGRVKSDRMVRDPSGRFQPFRAQIESLSLRKWLDLFEVRGPDEMVTDYGSMTGVADWLGNGTWQGQAKIQGAQIRLAQQTARGLQRFDELDVEFQQNRGDLRGRVLTAKPQGGSFKGQIDFEGETALRSSKLKFRFDELELDPAIEEMLWTGRSNGMKGKAEVEFLALGDSSGSWLRNLTAQVDIESFLQPGLEARKLRVDWSVEGSRWSSKIRAEEVTVGDGSVWTRWVQGPLLGVTGEVRALDAEIEGRRDGSFAKWSRVQWSSTGPTRVGLRGEMQGDEVKGQATVDYPKLKGARWRIAGGWREPKISPDEQSFRGIDPSALTNPDNRSTLRSSLGLDSP